MTFQILSNFLCIVDFNETVTDSKEFLILNILSYPPFSLRQSKLTAEVRGYLQVFHEIVLQLF